MSERISLPEGCRDCVNHRGGFLGTLLQRTDSQAEACAGPVKVAHGVIKTLVRQAGEPSPKPGEFTWNSLAGNDDGERRYSRIEWAHEQVCGRTPIQPREGEIPYSSAQPEWTTDDGQRHAAFVSGSELALADHQASQDVIALLDKATTVQAAHNRGDTEGVANAQDTINAQGFALGAVAGRGGPYANPTEM